MCSEASIANLNFNNINQYNAAAFGRMTLN